MCFTFCLRKKVKGEKGKRRSMRKSEAPDGAKLRTRREVPEECETDDETSTRKQFIDTSGKRRSKDERKKSKVKAKRRSDEDTTSRSSSRKREKSERKKTVVPPVSTVKDEKARAGSSEDKKKTLPKKAESSEDKKKTPPKGAESSEDKKKTPPKGAESSEDKKRTPPKVAENSNDKKNLPKDAENLKDKKSVPKGAEPETQAKEDAKPVGAPAVDSGKEDDNVDGARPRPGRAVKKTIVKERTKDDYCFLDPYSRIQIRRSLEDRKRMSERRPISKVSSCRVLR